jgi:hypothetical protein
MNEIRKTAAWKSFEKFRSSREVADVARHLQRGGKVRVEFFILDEN